MAKIIGGTAVSSMMIPDWNQSNPNRADFIKNKPDLDGTYTKLERTDNLESKTNSLEKRIVNLEQGITPSPFETDTSVAYTKDVPSNALPYAEVSSVGGMTRKSTNLWDEQWEVGFIETSTGNNATSTARIRSKNYIPCESETVYSFTVSSDSVIVYCYDKDKNFLGIKYLNNRKATTLANTCYMRFLLYTEYGTEYKNDVSVIKGETALPYEPYYDGLRSASVTEVESVGKNFLDLEALANTSNWLIRGYQYCSFPLYLKPNTKYTFSRKDDSVATAVFALFSRTPNSNQAGTGGAWFVYPNSTDLTKKVVTITTGDNGMMYMNLYYIPTAISALVALIGDAQLELGDTATPYKPYVRNTLPIPTEVQSLDGYGWGINESVYNYIDFEKKQFVKNVACVDMGTLDWVLQDANRFIANNLPYPTKAYNVALKGNGLISCYDIATWSNVNSIVYDKTFALYTSSIFVADTAYTDATTFKSAMSGVMLYYELAEPIVTDISDILSDDNFIGVEGNGTITFINEYSHDVPSEITYQIKEVAE